MALAASGEREGLLVEEAGDPELLAQEAEQRGPERRPCSSWAPRLLGGALTLLAVAGLAATAAKQGRPERLPSTRSSGWSEAVRLAAAPPTKYGVVAAIYTFGAPATAQTPLEDLHNANRCFGGLRSYNEDIPSPGNKQVDAASISNPHAHATMPVVVLRNSGDSVFVDCPGQSSWPSDVMGDVFANWGLHWEEDYTPRLQTLLLGGKPCAKLEPFATAFKFVILAYKSYDTTTNTRAAIAERLPGWKLVARETRIEGRLTLYDEDPVMIVQDTKSFDCALVFTGTNNAGNELSTSTTSYGTNYCGFQGVHVGYRNELWHITRDVFPKLRPKLAKCNKVSCVGHSLGGSLCEIFAACANSQRVDDPDFQQQAWVPETPAMSEEIEVGSSIFVGDAEHRCDEPPCPK